MHACRHTAGASVEQHDDGGARAGTARVSIGARVTAASRLGEALFREALYGRSLPGNAIDYVWTSRAPPSGTIPRTRIEDGLARRWSDTKWRSEEVDVEMDYRTLFGAAPPPIVAVAVMTDSDDACQRATAEFAEVESSHS